MELLIDAGANVDVPNKVREEVAACTHISEAISHRASPCSVAGPFIDTRAIIFFIVMCLCRDKLALVVGVSPDVSV